jgi:hypothetical protein
LTQAFFFQADKSTHRWVSWQCREYEMAMENGAKELDEMDAHAKIPLNHHEM